MDHHYKCNSRKPSPVGASLETALYIAHRGELLHGFPAETERLNLTEKHAFGLLPQTGAHHIDLSFIHHRFAQRESLR
jgi:hypothetical protein